MKSQWYEFLIKTAGEGVQLQPSKIHGTGVFATKPFGIGDKIGLVLEQTVNNPMEIVYQRTPVLGLYLNHQGAFSNAHLEKLGDNWYLFAHMYIAEGDEITVDYDRYYKQLTLEFEITNKSVRVS